MADNETNATGSPKPKPTEEESASRKRPNGEDIARKTLESDGPSDFKKLRSMEALRNQLTEKDSDLQQLAKEFLQQQDTIKRLKNSVKSKSVEIAKLKLSNTDASKRIHRLTDALITSSVTAVKSSDPPQEDGEKPSTSAGSSGEQPVKGKPDETKPEPKSLVDDPLYQAAIKDVDLSDLNKEQQSQLMVQFDEISLNDQTSFRYPVPPHLMGVLVGKQKLTMSRIMRQTCTEIEQMSWVEGEGASAIRVMGFLIKGSTDAIGEAIDEMLKTVKEMDAQKAAKIIRGHIKPDRMPDRKPVDGGKGKKGEMCPFFLKGNCKYGVKCRKSHSKGKK